MLRVVQTHVCNPIRSNQGATFLRSALRLQRVHSGCAPPPLRPECSLRVAAQAYTLALSGSRRPFIVVHTALLELLTPAEAQVVLAHELGHLKCEHGTWLTVANVIALGAVRGPLQHRAQMSNFKPQVCDAVHVITPGLLNLTTQFMVLLIHVSVPLFEWFPVQ